MACASTSHDLGTVEAVELSRPVKTSPSAAPKTTWNVVRTLGEGAFGEVKLVVDSRNLNIAVAMKCIDLANHPDVIDAVRKEALLQRMLRGHRNIIQYIGMRVESDDEFQIFLEYADGGELFDQIEPDVGMPSAKAQFYFRQLIDGVKFIHSNGIVHRDIKPENILLTQNDVLKISDFGMATVFRYNGQERLLNTKCGTLPYVSPQVLTGKYRGAPTDIWSCGVVLVALLAGELPWESPQPSTTAYANWKECPNLDEHPWKKIGTLALALLRTMLVEDESRRATIERIEKHPWFTADFVKNKGVLSRINSDAERMPDNGVPLKRRRCDLGYSGDSSVDSVSQPAAILQHSLNDTPADNRNGIDERIANASFSQPENIETLLLNHSQIDDTQRQCIGPLQLLVRRMTRFCVTVGIDEAMERIIEVCEASGFDAKKRGHNWLTVSDRREMSFMVTIYEMGSHATKKVMVDFRRSRGDGLEFKRAFIALKEKLDLIVCKEGTDWLERLGLVCSQALHQLSVN